MMSCAEAARQLSDRMNEKSMRRMRPGLRMHLLMCSGCRRYANQLQLIRTWLRSRRLADPAEGNASGASLDEAAREKILSVIQKDNL